METVYLACSKMVLIHLLTMLHRFFFLYGYHSFYQLFENCLNARMTFLTTMFVNM